MTEPGKAISGTAFATLLLIALMMGANHVAARIAFNNGVDVATAVVFRSAVTALVIVALLGDPGCAGGFTARHKRMLTISGPPSACRADFRVIDRSNGSAPL